MSKILFPDPPLTPGQSFDAPNGVTYTWDATIGTGVWVAATTAPVAPLTITNPGTITGTAEVGATLSYATGTATGGTGAIGYTWQWFITPTTPLGAANAPTVTVPAGALAKNIYVTLTATDSATPTPASATANTANYPTPPNVIQPKGITNAVVPTTIPGTATFAWADGSQSLTATGCIEFSTNGGVSFGQGPTAVSNGNTVITQWIDSAPCGQAANGTTINGTLTDGTNTSSFSFTINRVPGSFSLSPNTETTTPSTITANDPSFTLSGGNTAPLVWGVLTGGGSTPQFSIDGGTTWLALPSAPTAGVSVPQGVATIVRFTTSGSAGTETLDVFAGASTTAGEYHSALFTVTVASTPFPNSTFTPSGAPNASPASVSTGTLHGTATCASWADGSVSLSSTGGIQFQVNGGGYGTGPTAVANGNTVDVIWDPAAITAAADNAVLTGTLTNGVYTNTYTITVTRAVTGLSFTDLTNQALSTAVTSNVITPAGFNVPVALSYVGSANAMTAIGVAVGGGGFAASPQTVNPGQTLQVQGTTGGTISTPYGVTLTMGSGPVATDTWTATTVAATPAVTTPSISTPANNATNQGTASGITITSSAYAASGGAGTHASSDWELYANGYPLTSANTISGVTQNSSTWTLQTSPLPGVQDVAYGNGKFVAIGRNQGIATSPDGVTWTAQTSPFAVSTGPAAGITYGNGKFVAFSGTDTATSPDGVTWTLAAGSLSTAGAAIRWTGSKFAIISRFNRTFSSTDGAAWTSGAATANMSAIVPDTSTGDLYGFDSFAGGAVYKSTNAGVSWTSVGTFPNPTFAGDLGIYAGVYNSGRLVVNSSGPGQTYYSDNGGVSWTATTGTSGGTLYDAIYANGLYMFIGTTNLVRYSTDGINFTADTGNVLTGASIFGVAFGNDLWVTVGGSSASPAISTSADPRGTTTLLIANCQTEGFLAGDTVISGSGAAAGPAKIISLDNTQVTVAPPSTSWVGTNTQTLKRDPASYSLASSATADTVNKVSWPVAKPPLAANTTYYTRVRYTSNATVVTSDWSGWSKFTTGSLIFNPTTWIKSSSTDTTASPYSGCYDAVANKYYFGCTNGDIWRSTDGAVNWTRVYTGTAHGGTNLVSMAANNDYIVAVFGAAGGGIQSTNGGATWGSVASFGASTINSVAYGNGRFIALDAATTVYVNTSSTSGGWTTPGGTVAVSQGSLAYLNDRWLACGGQKVMASTNDGTSWTQVYSTGSGLIGAGGATYGTTKFVLQTSSAGTPTFYSSTTGASGSWTSSTTPAGYGVLNFQNSAASLGGSILFGGSTVKYSIDDGTTWSTATGPSSIYVAIAGSDRYVVIPQSSAPANVYYSVG